MEFQWNLDEEFEKGQIIESEDETGYLPDFHYGKLCVRLNLANNAESWIMKHETSESSGAPIGIVCYIPNRYDSHWITKIRISKISQHSLYAEVIDSRKMDTTSPPIQGENILPFSSNHSRQVGDIVETQGEQVAIADPHEIWEHDPADYGKGSWKTTGEATVRILVDTICTNRMNVRGLVCYLPDEYKGCGIIKARITKIHNKSVEAVPIDYIQGDKPLAWYLYGKKVADIIQEHPYIKRITSEGSPIIE